MNIEELRILNETFIKYYKEDEKKSLKFKIIKELLEDDNIFRKIPKEDAILLLKDLQIKNKEIDEILEELR